MAERKRKVWGSRIREILTERKEIEVEELLALTKDLVHPGVAARLVREERKKSREYDLRTGRNITGRTAVRHYELEEDVELGKRRIILDLVANLVRNGTVERFTKDDERWIRLIDKTGWYVILRREDGGLWRERGRVQARTARDALLKLDARDAERSISVPLRYFVARHAGGRKLTDIDTIVVSRNAGEPAPAQPEDSNDRSGRLREDRKRDVRPE